MPLDLGAVKSRVVCGRKFCGCCKRWRLVMEFGVDSKWPNGDVRYLTSWCHTCERLRQRARADAKPRVYHSRTPAQQRALNNERQNRRRQQNREWAERRREYERLWKEVQRRRAGIPPRPFGPRAQPRVVDGEVVPRVDVEPFRRWLAGELVKYERLRELAVVVGMDESHVGHILEGRQSSVSLDTVDRALTRMDVPLWEMYPDLYPDVVPPGELEAAA